MSQQFLISLFCHNQYISNIIIMKARQYLMVEVDKFRLKFIISDSSLMIKSKLSTHRQKLLVVKIRNSKIYNLIK